MISLNNRKRIMGLGLIFLGCAVLLITVLGQWTGVGGYTNFPPRSWERFDPVLAENTPDIAALYHAAESRVPGQLNKLPPAQTMRILYETVADRFTHGDQARHTLFSNWILGICRWLPEPLSRDLTQIRIPENTLKYGYSALCGQQAGVLVQLAEKAGIDARIVGLSGHVVMEAYYNNHWHMFDPDMEVIPNYSGKVYSVAELETLPELAAKLYINRPEWQTWTSILTTGKDNYAFPVGSNSISPNYQKLEQSLELMKWIIPIVLFFLGLRFSRKD